MIFIEKKIHDGYSYEVEDVFGKISIESVERIDKYDLDMLVMTIMKMPGGEGRIGEKTKYNFEKADAWVDDGVEIEEVPPTLLERIKNYIKSIWN